MFLYTPRADLLRELLQKSRSSSYRSNVYRFANEVLTSTNYSYVMNFLKHWKYTKYYSQERLERSVPVNGVLYPIALFSETKLEN